MDINNNMMPISHRTKWNIVIQNRIDAYKQSDTFKGLYCVRIQASRECR